MTVNKKAIDLTGLDRQIERYNARLSRKAIVFTKGIGGDKLLEPVPQYLRAKCEKEIANENNASIILGRDRPASRLSGYGGKGDTQTGTIDIVCGRMGSSPRQVDERGGKLFVDPNFKLDSARIYISQKTDVDKNFELASGKVGDGKTKSAIALKADGIRLIAREGIKLVTRTDKRNSQGSEVKSINGIDLIAGNDDTDLQPIPKGTNLVEGLRNLTNHLDKLNGIVDSFLTAQMEFNEAITHHTHNSPFFALPTTPSILLIPSGVKTMISQLTSVKISLMSHKANLATYQFNYFEPSGTRFINSRYNHTN
jgi:hypothetical protein